MKIPKQLIMLLLILVVASSFLLFGCNISKRTPIVTLNNIKLYREDFLYNIYLIESEGNQLEDYYINNLGYGYWDYEYEGTTIRDTAKSAVLTQVVMNEIMSDQAKQKGYALTERELSQNKEAVDLFIKSISEEAFKEMGLTRELLNTVYNKTTLSDKYYHDLSKGFGIDEGSIKEQISKDAYREYKTECLFIPSATVKDQKLSPLDEDKIKAAYAIISEAYTKLAKGDEFASILNNYDGLSYYSRDFIYGDSIYEEEYQDVATTLKNGSYSQVITTVYGFYIIHMLDNYSTDQYDQAVAEAIKLEEELKFAPIYHEMKKQYDISINFDYWNTIIIGSVTTPKDN